MLALNALLILAVLVGHLAIARVWLARIHTTLLPILIWRPLLLLSSIALVLLPLLFLFFLHPSLLRTQPLWRTLPLFWQIYTATCLASCALAMIAVVRGAVSSKAGLRNLLHLPPHRRRRHPHLPPPLPWPPRPNRPPPLQRNLPARPHPTRTKTPQSPSRMGRPLPPPSLRSPLQRHPRP